MFRALADPTRRELLDELFRQNGQSLNALAGRFAMTRVAVAKHLRLLEEAGLVVSDRRGREKLHFLNPVPIRLIHDRWVSKYTETWAAGLVDLKRDLETCVEKVFEIYIRTTPQRLWQAITDPETREQPDQRRGRRQNGDRVGELAGATLDVGDAGFGVLPHRVHDVVVDGVGQVGAGGDVPAVDQRFVQAD
ncbi:hypothetical protein GCM10023194_40450 [Planotetraspora phitsanulokensis]|uniref:HTH arsR-type domain-containing protein n=1 Tax=Planotetraspora phitsanulokensis TaxID=575192 RepID=A0A8J3XLR1_9ACTN|nr:hypothetical protein Pph01_59710 [Planotetraspora phitsanulokensis]